MDDTSPSNRKSVNCRTTAVRKTKASIVERMLRRGKGATIAEIANATGWQQHSCRAFLTGVRKKGVIVSKEQRSDEKLAYRIIEAKA